MKPAGYWWFSHEEGGFWGPDNGDLKERCLVVLGEDQEEIELLVGEMPGGSLLCS